MSERQTRRTVVGAWVVYDIATTVFWAGVVGLGFPLWVTKGAGDVPSGLSGDDATLGYTLAAAMLVVLVMAPILGAITDQAGRRMHLLLVATLVCIGATLLLGNGGLVISLGLFALALCSMELGTIVYNALLVEVSTEANRGTIAGLGIGIGYVGAFIAVGAALLLTEQRGYVFFFRVIALLYLLFSLPIFIFLKERQRDVLPSTVFSQIVQAFSQLSGNLRSLDRFPGLRMFLVARFLYAVGINTATAFAVVYASQTIGLSDREIQVILLAGISIAIPSGALWGIMVDRVGAKPVLTFSLLIWMGLLLFAAGIAWLSLTKHLWWIVGCFTGVAIAGVFTADRPYMLSFAPPQYLGEFFGLHGMVGKLGRAVGPFLWAFIAATLGLGQIAAVLGLLCCLVVSYVILGRLQAPARSASGHPVDDVS